MRPTREPTMSEHDPIRDLESFGTGGVTMTPIPASEVRRLGNRRRARRRTTAVVAGAVVAVLAIGVPVALTHGGDARGSGYIADQTPTPTSAATQQPSPTATASDSATAPETPATPQVITYPGIGIEVSAAADADKLTGTSAEFKAFIADQAEKAAADGGSCPDAAHGVAVHKYSSAGYAVGSVNSRGGYVALWVIHDNTWQEGYGTQDVWDCAVLNYYGVPHSFAGDCFNYTGDFGPSKVQGLRLGMS